MPCQNQNPEVPSGVFEAFRQLFGQKTTNSAIKDKPAEVGWTKQQSRDPSGRKWNAVRQNRHNAMATKED